jgi:adenosylcobinamide-GDP ribazoletransferase
MNAFLQALTFLTRLPVRFRPQPEAWPRSTAYYPLVGLIIGLAICLFSWVSHLAFPSFLASVITLGGWIWITGGLHLDGLMDVADGIGSARSRERMIEIMKDSRVGAMGVIAAIATLLVKGAALDGLAADASGYLLLAAIPLLSRTGLLLSIRHWPYLHEQSAGMARSLKAGLSLKRYAASLSLAVLAAWLLTGFWAGLVFLLCWLLFACLFNRMITAKLGGLSGDAYGALVEGSEAVLLAIGAAYLHLGGSVGW